MKRMDLFCASPASTAICTAMDHRAMVRRGHGRPPIERSNSSKPYYAPCSSELPITPRPYSHHHHEKSRKSSSANKLSSDLRRKSSANVEDLKSPGDSSRYLLSDKPFIDWISSESDHRVSALVPTQSMKPSRHVISSNDQSSPFLKHSLSSRNSNDTPVFKSSSSTPSNDSPALRSSSSHKSRDQVVVLRVSIHCKGCEGKIRKHISKMKGVTSFNIDLATKKVTVIGDVTPLGVLESVSRVKSAQLWPSSTSSSLSSPLINMSYSQN